MTRRPSWRAVPLCALVVWLIAGLLPASAARAEATPRRPVTPSPSPSAEEVRPFATARLRADASLSDVVALRADDVWAVGQEGVWDDWQSRAVITHWDGSSWSTVGIRNDASSAGRLRSIAAASPGELWAVGQGHDSLPYVAKGDGSVFDRVDVPRLGSADWLGGVAAISGRVVAVGGRDGRPLVATGTGDGWTIATHGASGVLYGVTLLSAKEGWAVGDTGSRPLILRLTGSGWKTAKVPTIKGGFLRDVYAASAKRVIAVGGVHRKSGIFPLVLYWNGAHWTRMHVPGGAAELYGVTGEPHVPGRPQRYWISGYDPADPQDPYLLRYEHGKWHVDRGERTGGDSVVRLQAVSHVDGLTMAVGHVVDDRGRYTDVIETLDSPAPAGGATGRAREKAAGAGPQMTAPSSQPESLGGRSPMRTTSATNPPMKAATAAKRIQPRMGQPSSAASSR